MSQEILSLHPQRIWYYFSEILKIPRPSKKEDKIARYLLDFAEEHKLKTLRDDTGNILIRKPACRGYEDRKMVCLQSHIDMVGEKNSNIKFDFEKDPIEAYVEDGWIKARGTTLGADDGIGVAASLAILESDSIEHGPLECLFTVDEETGMTGAFGLQSGFLKSEILLNLDSEDEGQLFIGCAGGKDTTIEIPYLKESVPDDMSSFLIKVSGLKGGHSGDDIEKGLGNACKILNRLLWNAAGNFGLRLSKFDAGNLRNAIAREGHAIVATPVSNGKDLVSYVSSFNQTLKDEYKVTEPGLKIEISPTDLPSYLIDKKTQSNLLNALYACPHGVIAWSMEIPDFVETSTNLASVKTEENLFKITTSQRSSVESAKKDIGDRVAATFSLTGGKIISSDGYPGWTPNPGSEIVAVTEGAYKDLFKKDPEVLAVHAGLECGLIGSRYPEMDMISYGPEIKGAHSPDERLQIESTQRFWELTLEVLKRIPKK
ncbi:MAG: aminoacyl-histidine dipeptidase [Bacteroidales bacterium]|nr:aminoacyl-histidine dipeptidase [Bacteroidales bacterium]MCF8387269.1 aminoacyl-histidine dipeptidase [Bacteroidales bacterium]MCF8396885.1 aminoacyl-histidine dipeptidase [Bacteroidales bacterium]